MIVMRVFEVAFEVEVFEDHDEHLSVGILSLRFIFCWQPIDALLFPDRRFMFAVVDMAQRLLILSPFCYVVSLACSLETTAW